MNAKPKRLLLLTIVALVLGIGGSKVIRVLATRTQADIEKPVAARMEDSTLPQFTNVRRDEINEHVWCGEVSGKDSFDDSVDYQRFFVRVSSPGGLPLVEFDEADNRAFIDKMCGGAPSHASE